MQSFFFCFFNFSGRLLSSPDGSAHTRLCLSHGSHLCEKRAALMFLPNYDLRLPSSVVIYISPGMSYDLDALKEVVGSSCRRVLLPSKLAEYPNSRWTGADTAWDECCLGEGPKLVVAALILIFVMFFVFCVILRQRKLIMYVLMPYNSMSCNRCTII